jgi:zinc transporter 9
MPGKERPQRVRLAPLDYRKDSFSLTASTCRAFGAADDQEEKAWADAKPRSTTRQQRKLRRINININTNEAIYSRPDIESFLARNSNISVRDPRISWSRTRTLTTLPDDKTFSGTVGKMQTPSDPSSSASTTTAADRRAELLTRRARSERNLILQKDIEMYADIVRKRARVKERNRKKMASNIYRALCGNVAICTAKGLAWLSSGSSALLAELVHSLVDCGNQALLIVGLRESQMSADRRHPYGYGKSIYFWALVSALGTFFLGAGVSMTHAIGSILEPSLQTITPEVWGVLVFSLGVDGYVLTKTIAETRHGQPKGVSYWKHLQNIRDPAVMAVLLEDGAACLGVVMAFGGIAASHITGNPIYDGVAGVGISFLLGVMGVALTRMNYRFLLGQSVDREITDDIEQILLKRKSIDRVGMVQSQWTGPETFSFKAEVDFDGTYLAAILMPIYQREFLEVRDTMDTELRVLLALYAEDVMRATEREIRHVEAMIRLKYPGAEFIELEPMSLDVDRLAIDDNLESDLKRVEMESLDRYLTSLKKDAHDLERQENNETKKPPTRV